MEHPDPNGAIRERLRRYPGLELHLRLIGLGLTQQAQSLAADLASQTGGTFRNATSPAELGDALQHALVVQARVNEVQIAVGVLTEGMNHLNAALGTHLAKLDYEAADREVREAEQAVKRAVVPSPDPQQPEGVRTLLGLARQALDDQQKMLDAAMALVAARKSGDTVAEGQARRAYNSAGGAYAVRAEQIDSLRTELLAK